MLFTIQILFISGHGLGIYTFLGCGLVVVAAGVVEVVVVATADAALVVSLDGVVTVVVGVSLLLVDVTGGVALAIGVVFSASRLFLAAAVATWWGEYLEVRTPGDAT